MTAAGFPRLVLQNQWIAGDGPAYGGADAASMPGWRVHGLGHVHIEHQGRVLTVRVDAGGFDRDRCARLVAALERFDGRAGRVDLAVWSGGAGAAGRWITASFATCDEARRFARQVGAVANGSESATTLRTATVGRDAVPGSRRKFFDRLAAAWAADRSPRAEAVRALFRPGCETPHQGLKIVRRFGANLRFEAYRMATGHRWIRNQAVLMDGGDLRALLDRRLAATLLRSVTDACSAGGPAYEAVSGLVQVETGYRFTEYHRLTLPLADGGDDVALVATCW